MAEDARNRNPLVVMILPYIRGHQRGCTLLALVNHCEAALQSLVSGSAMSRAFEKNFLVMNGLYQLQQQLLSEHGLYLSISPMDIHIQLGARVVGNNDVARDASLASYYLDWNNLVQTTEQDIAELLADFWRGVTSTEKVDWAASVLGVILPLQKGAVISAYRAQASITHPDKGGRHEDFVDVRQAYEILLAQCRNDE
jgi:hypothetical protein